MRLLAAALLLALGPTAAGAQSMCGAGTVPGVTFDLPFDFTGTGRVMPRHTRSADLLRTWSWSCDDPDGGFPLSLRCQVWDTCRVGGPCSSNASAGNPAVTLLVETDCGTATSGPFPVTSDYDVPAGDLVPDHRYFYSAECADSSGNTCQVSFPFWYDVEPPVAALDPSIVPAPPPAGGSTVETTAHLGFSCTDNSKDYDFFSGPAATATARCSLFLDGTLLFEEACGPSKITVDGSETATVAYADLAPGDYRFEVVCVDAAIDFDAAGIVHPGNESAPASTEWTVESPAPLLGRYMLFKAKPAKVEGNELPKDFNLTLDDAFLPDTDPDDPENFTAVKPKDVALADGDGPAYVVYQIKSAKEGASDPLPSNGKLPKPGKHLRRRIEVSNTLGDLVVETKKARFLWVPAELDLDGVPVGSAEGDHFLCYDVKATRDVTAQTPDDGKGKGVFAKGLQTVLGDALSRADCALDRDGEPSFPGSAAAGRCLYELKKPKVLCHPVATRNVEPPRVTSAAIVESSPDGTEALLCYLAKLASKVQEGEGADATGLAAGTKIRQRKHEKRSALGVTVGSGFPAPFAVDTKKSELVCLPTSVVAVEPE